MRLSLSLVFVILLLIHFLTSGIAAEKMRIAVLDLKADGVQGRTARTVSDMIRTDMVNTGKFIVIERAQMDAIMKEQGLQMTGCTDQDCAVQIGKVMSARKILVGSVSPLGQAIVINVRIVDVELGLVEYAAREKADTEAALDEAVSSITKKLSSRIAGEGFFERFTVRPEREQPKAKEEKKEDKKKTKTSDKGILQESIMTGYYLRSIVPGWGQFYAGETSKGYAFSGAFVAAAAFSAWAIMDYGKKKKAYDDLPSGEPKSVFDSKYDAYKKASSISLISVGIVGAIYLANWVDVLFFSKPEFSIIGNAQISDGGVFLGINPLLRGDGCPEQGMIVSVSMRF